MFFLRKIVKTLFLVLLISMAVACVTMPAQEMSDARQALQAAEQVNAAEKAPDVYQEAKALLEQAQLMIKDNNYYEARRLADAAKETALIARKIAIGEGKE